MADTSTPVYNPPASNGAIIFGTTATTGGGARRVVHLAVDGTTITTTAGFEYSAALDQLSVGATPQSTGVATKFHAIGNANDLVSVGASNSSVFGQAGVYAQGAGGPECRFASCGAAAGATLFGQATANTLRVSAGSPILLGCTSSDNVVLGNGSTAKMTVRGDGSRIAHHVAIGIDPTTIGDAAKTITAGEGNIQFTTTLTAARACNLPAASAAGVGYRQMVHSYGANNGANVVTINPNGSDVINGGGALATSSAYHTVELVVVDATVGAGRWGIERNHAL